MRSPPKNREKKAPDPATAPGRALGLLSRREHSARELSRKLTQRGFEAQTASETVQKMSDAGYQSDDRFIETRVGSRIRQGFGPRRIAADLFAAGISSARVKEALANVEVDWPAEARAAFNRRFSGPAADAAAAQKQFRYLASRGFETWQIRQVLGAAADNAEVDDDEALIGD